MNRSAKAALLSGLVFPGVGQLFLGRVLRGLLFLIPALAAAWYFSSVVLGPVMELAHEVMNGTLLLDPLDIEDRLHAKGQVVSPLANVAALVMLVTWIGSTIDAWLAGREPAPKAAPGA